MATLIGGALGAGVGFLVGGPAGARLGFAIGTTLGSVYEMMTQPGTHVEQGRLTDLRVSGASYGTPIPMLWGPGRVPGLIIWQTPLQEHPHTSDVGGGGSAGGGGSVTSFSYTSSMAVCYGRGSVMMPDGSFVHRHPVVKRIRADDLIVWDIANTSSQNVISPTFYDGGETQAVDPTMSAVLTAQGLPCPAYRGYAMFVLSDMDLTPFNNRIPNWSVDYDTDVLTVGDVFSDVSRECGVPLSKIDISGCTDTFQGVGITSITAGQDIVDMILTNYMYDMVEVDFTLRPVKRGGAIVATISARDLGTGTDTGTDTKITEKRVPDIELPGSVVTTYYSSDLFFEQNTQSDTRQDANVANVSNVNLPLTLSDGFARSLSSQLLDISWIEREQYQFNLPYKYIWLSCGDPVLLPVNNDLIRVRITSMDIGMVGEIKCDAVRDSTSAITQTLPGGGGGGTGGSGYPVVVSDFVAFSGPELRKSDRGVGGFYVGARALGGATGWRGAVVYYSPDSGTTWIRAGILNGQAVWGTTVGTLTTASTTYPTLDTNAGHNVVVNTTNGGLLASTSDAAAANGTNACRVGNEILSFVNAALVTAGQYTLSRMYRQILGTVGSGHGAGELFALADMNLIRVPVNDALIGATIPVKVVSLGDDITTVTAKNVVISTPTPSDLQDVTNRLDAIVPQPSWRMRSYLANVAATDATYYNDGSGPGVNYPGGVVQFNFRKDAESGGSFMYETPGMGYKWWGRMGIRNTTGSNITFNYWLPAYDNYLKLIFDGTVLQTNAAFDTRGSIVVSANTDSIIEFFYYNNSLTWNPSDQGLCTVIIDAFDQTGLVWYDVGP